MKLIAYLAFIASLTFGLQAKQQPDMDFSQASREISALMSRYHYNPKELTTPEYRKLEQQVAELAKSSSSKQQFIDSFNQLWVDGPFSHVRLDHAHQPAEKLADYLDGMRVGGHGASLLWQGKVAILTVNTMMGLDTMEQIDAAYDQLASQQAQGLIIDLRNNKGGAFAVKPLVGHLIQQSLDVGAFISQPWNRAHDTLPSQQEVLAKKAWQGWSIKAFWKEVQNNAITRVQFQPLGPHFSGPVYVLTSQTTASAAELAADALGSIEGITLVGEKTAGTMLSQRMYDLSGGLQLFLPIADYYSAYSGRIEQEGVTPDVELPAQQALDYAIAALEKASYDTN